MQLSLKHKCDHKLHHNSTTAILRASVWREDVDYLTRVLCSPVTGWQTPSLEHVTLSEFLSGITLSGRQPVSKQSQSDTERRGPS